MKEKKKHLDEFQNSFLIPSCFLICSDMRIRFLFLQCALPITRDHALPNRKPEKNLHSLLTCFLISTYYTTESNTVSEVSQTLMGSFTCPEINGREKQCNSWGQKSNKTELAQCQGRDTMRINMSQKQSSIFSASREGNQREMSHYFTSGECEPWAPQYR